MGLVTWKDGVPFGSVSGRNLNLADAKTGTDNADGASWGTFTTDDILSRLGGGVGPHVLSLFTSFPLPYSCVCVNLLRH